MSAKKTTIAELKNRCHIGTSGWQYRDWGNGRFYPPGCSGSQCLEFFTQKFSTVELNVTFYRMPRASTFEGWRERTPDGFLFAVKMSRRITHYARLDGNWDYLEEFLRRAGLLGERLGPILIQLPPSFRLDLARLAAFQERLPADMSFAFEFRHASWFTEETYGQLERFGHAFVVYHMPRLAAPYIAPAPLVYMRFHGCETLYKGNCPGNLLAEWAGYIRDRVAEGRDVFAYFNNDYEGCALDDAASLLRMLGLPAPEL